MTEAKSSEPQKLTDPAEILFRQIHPAKLKRNGSLSPSHFMPGDNDEGMMSTNRETIGPDEAHRRWTEELEKPSLGTMGISVEEIDGISITPHPDRPAGATAVSLQALDDAKQLAIPDHASVDFTQCEYPAELRQGGRKLLELAEKREWLYKPEEPTIT